MANIKWSGIESKYGLTARWYVSAQYGSDTDVDTAGLYDPSTNVTGWGGPTRPFDSLDTLENNASVTGVVILDSGRYTKVTGNVFSFTIIGDGNVILDLINLGAILRNLYNLTLVQCTQIAAFGFVSKDCLWIYSSPEAFGGGIVERCTYIECNFLSGTSSNNNSYNNILLIRCTGSFMAPNQSYNIIIIDSSNLTMNLPVPRGVGRFLDYSVLIGTVKNLFAINGKTTGITLEDFKLDGNYFGKSFSEVDLWGNVSGSGASVAQLQEIFNNYFSPIYIDDYQYADFSLKPTVDPRIRYGGLSGHFIGALPVGYSYDISTLWNTYQDVVNTSNVEIDGVSFNLVLSSGQTTGIFTTTEIVLPIAVTADVSMFFKNNVFNAAGVAVQRIDTTDDVAPSNTVNQRTVYSYRLKISPDDGTPLGAWKEYELDRSPTVDASGNANAEDAFDVGTETTQTIKKFALEITLRDLS